MKIYTKTGDSGETSTYSGARRPKSDLIFHIIGNIDYLGVLIAESIREIEYSFWHRFIYSEEMVIENYLRDIQKKLFKINSIIATTKSDAKFKPKKYLNLEDISITDLEEFIDYMTIKLPPLKNFIFPNSTSRFPIIIHKARAHTRLTERLLVEYNNTVTPEDKLQENVQKYINRLSDLFFTLARYYNFIKGIPEITVEIS